jgi:hypothetical protein
MTHVYISPKEFTEKLKNTRRFWDHKKKEGLASNQLSRAGLFLGDMDYIFVRNDGWSIACSKAAYHSCHNLWKEEWETVYEKN